jgi:hypothetical protein
MNFRTVALALSANVGLSLASMANASAATLSYEETAGGVSGSGAMTNYSHLPVSDFFGNTLGPSSGTLGAPADPGFTFYDDFVFTVASSTLDAASFLLNEGSTLAIDNLQMRVYSASGNTPPVLGNSPAGLRAGWSNPISTNGASSTLGTTLLGSGTYVLEVRGDVVGTAGGSYAGIIDLQPVPLPAAFPLMLSGLGLVAGLARKRTAS